VSPQTDDPARHWTLDPGCDFLNHGSFGACPREVLATQSRLRAQIERQPVRFFMREHDALLDQARVALAAVLDAEPAELVFVPNATTGVNAVLRALPFAPGDELLTTDHAYNACANALRFVAERAGARVVVARMPFPVHSPDEAVAAVLAAVTPRTRLALIDHVTSPTALVLPVARIVRALAERGVDTLVDGAHAPGMVPLSLRALGAAYYTGNCHKWLCAPKGAGFLAVRADRQARVRPAVISHGANSPRTDRSRFQLEFDWTGTADPTAYLAVPAAIAFLSGLLPGGLASLMDHNRALALRARAHLAAQLGTTLPCPDEMIGAIASVPLPDGPALASSSPPPLVDPLQDALLARYQTEVPIVPWPAPPGRLVRISAQHYNRFEQYERLATHLRALL
jgi:isopenicillin-N epimerase